MVAVNNYLWDSCVFIAYLKDEVEAYDVASLQQYLEETKQGVTRIYASTISSAEVLPSKIKKAYGTYEEFLSDFEGAVVAIDPNPNIMQLAGQLRDLPYAKGSGKRVLSTPDSIILATAVYLQEAYHEKLTAVHSFDTGKKKGVPIVGLEEWTQGFSVAQTSLIKRVIDIPRAAPRHPAPLLPYGRK